MQAKEVMSETDALRRLSEKIGGLWTYKGKDFKFESVKPLPIGRFTVFTDKHTISFFRSETEAFLASIIPAQPKPVRKVQKPLPAPPIVRHTPTPTNTGTITMEIKETTDYTIFGNISGNRRLNLTKVEKLTKDVQGGLNMLPYCPIIVYPHKGQLLVYDGQHRVEVSKRTNSPVYYVECHTLTLQQIAQINSRGEKWKPVDYLNCYITDGNADYILIRRMMNEYGAPIKVAIQLLMNFKTEGHGTEDFQSGQFKCNHLEKTEALLKLMNDLFAGYNFCMDRYLIKAIMVIQAKGLCDFDRLKKKLQSDPTKMEKQADYKKYCTALEAIYNLHKSNRDPIY